MAEFEQIYDKKKRQRVINENIKQIKQALSDVPDDVIELNKHLIEEAANYAMQISEMNELIKRDGVVDYYQNGANQFGTKKSVAAELKPKYTATYQSLIRQLMELLPTEVDDSEAAEIREFITRGAG